MELRFIIKIDSRFRGNDREERGNDNKKNQKVSLCEIPQRGTKTKDQKLKSQITSTKPQTNSKL